MKRKALILLLALGLVSCEAPDSAGREYTEIPYRRYMVDDYRVLAFELYGLKCVAGFGNLDCEEVGR